MDHDPQAEMVRQLCDTDQSLPPPPGHAITTERLRVRLHKRRRRALLAMTTLLLATVSLWQIGSRSTDMRSGDTAELGSDDELHALTARIDRLLAELAAPMPEVCRDQQQLRFELANARARSLAQLDPEPNQQPRQEIR